jgi:Molybdenum cofactor biosynthesis protein F.
MNRRWTAFTAADVQYLADHTPVEQYSTAPLQKGEYMPAFTSRLNGRTVTITFDDGQALTYAFRDTHRLTWTGSDGLTHEEYCQIVEAPGDDRVLFVQHYCAGSAPPTAHTLILDFGTGLATVCIASIGVPESAREVSRTFRFGLMDGYPDPGYRHGFTRDLVGKAILWTYNEQEGYRIKHIYSSPLYYTYMMWNAEAGTRWVASNPADYIKINDDLYVFSFVEERQAGTQGLFLINLRTLHDVGSFFGVHIHGIECYVFGAKGEYVSRPDLN